MNLRILKKLSKRAAPLVTLIGDDPRKQFPAERGENYTVTCIMARKHWDRSNCHPTFKGRGRDIVFTTRAGRRMVMRPPHAPLKGTVMVGGMSGYYEPEWDEETAWCSLAQSVRMHFTDWGPDGGTPTRTLRTTREILRAAVEMADAARRPARPTHAGEG